MVHPLSCDKVLLHSHGRGCFQIVEGKGVKCVWVNDPRRAHTEEKE